MFKIYKFLSVILSLTLLGSIGFYFFKKRSFLDSKRILNNSISKLEGTIQETETLFSRNNLEVLGIVSENKELTERIKDRNEKILAQSEISMKWRDKFYNLKAKQSIVPFSDPDSVTKEASESCTTQGRVKVEFEHEDPPIKIYGYTLTDPPEAALQIEWMEDLELELNLTKTEDGKYKIYVDTKNSPLKIKDIELKLDPSVLGYSWYEKIGVGSSLSLGEYGGQIRVGTFYDISDSMFLGPNFVVQYDGTKAKVFYGISIGYYPFR